MSKNISTDEIAASLGMTNKIGAFLLGAKQPIGATMWDDHTEKQIKELQDKIFIGKHIGFIKSDKVNENWESMSKDMRLNSPARFYVPVVAVVESFGLNRKAMASSRPALDLTYRLIDSPEAKPIVATYNLSSFWGLPADASKAEINHALSTLDRGTMLYDTIFGDIESLRDACVLLNSLEIERLTGAMQSIYVDLEAGKTITSAIQALIPYKDR